MVISEGLKRWQGRAERIWLGLRAHVRPLEYVPCAVVDANDLSDPMPSIVSAPEFTKTVQWFSQDPASNRSQLSPEAQAILFTMVRNLKPAHAFEIGTFQAGTSEAICRAMQANGTGVLHTTDPFGLAAVPAILFKWPRQLRRHVRFYHLDSMAFFMLMERIGTRSALTLIDGRHDYEFAMFDLSMAARTLLPGGFIFLDNISQPGPFLAVSDFVRNMPGWSDCGNALGPQRNSRPFDKHRQRIHNTDLIALRASAAFIVGSRPVTSGEQRFDRQEVRGVRLTIGQRSSRGVLSVQCVLRGHSSARGSPGVEMIGETRLDLDGTDGTVTARFDPPLTITGIFYQMATETALVWDGDAPLPLAEPPTVF
jgi:hypothetical protein